jgi:hypothetical protein
MPELAPVIMATLLVSKNIATSSSVDAAQLRLTCAAAHPFLAPSTQFESSAIL